MAGFNAYVIITHVDEETWVFFNVGSSRGKETRKTFSFEN
jgi:hypothetical protein